MASPPKDGDEVADPVAHTTPGPNGDFIGPWRSCSPSDELTLHAWSHSFAPRMARKKISTTVYITPEQDERLKLLNDRTKVPVAEYIRQGIDLVLDKYRAALPGQLSLDELERKG
jgi:hypothetical protein